MEYEKTIRLKNGSICHLRSATAQDGQAVLENFNTTHAETDFLLTYPEESSFTADQESDFLARKLESPNEIELLAIVDGRVVGTAGVDALGRKYKLRHRAEFGVSVLRDYWGLGIGGALLDSCIECARRAGFLQLELTAVADNESALALYKKKGFSEYGRNPLGFRSRQSGFQELVLMRLEL